jgi:hypothetical protein
VSHEYFCLREGLDQPERVMRWNKLRPYRTVLERTVSPAGELTGQTRGAFPSVAVFG